MRQRVFGFQNAGLRRLAASGFALLIGIGSAIAQSGDLRTQDQPKPGATSPATPADAAKDNQRKTDEFVEASQALNGPAGNPECVWLGRRVVVPDVARRSRHRLPPSRPLRPLWLPRRSRSGDVQVSRALWRHRPQSTGKPERTCSCLLDQPRRPASGCGCRTTGLPRRWHRGTVHRRRRRGGSCSSRGSSAGRGRQIAAQRLGTIRNSCDFKTRALKTSRRHMSC